MEKISSYEIKGEKTRSVINTYFDKEILEFNVRYNNNLNYKTDRTIKEALEYMIYEDGDVNSHSAPRYITLYDTFVYTYGRQANYPEVLSYVIHELEKIIPLFDADPRYTVTHHGKAWTIVKNRDEPDNIYS